jgi:hypothetical protein
MSQTDNTFLASHQLTTSIHWPTIVLSMSQTDYTFLASHQLTTILSVCDIDSTIVGTTNPRS